jgi:hypothetical protein
VYWLGFASRSGSTGTLARSPDPQEEHEMPDERPNTLLEDEILTTGGASPKAEADDADDTDADDADTTDADDAADADDADGTDA